jgi:5-methylcytosine-specific restriction protein A
MPTIPKEDKRPWHRKPTVTHSPQHQATNYDLYNSKKWRNYSKRFLSLNPLCIKCKSKGRMEPASICDHIDPINLGGDVWDVNNHQPLCNTCHQRKRAQERWRYKREQEKAQQGGLSESLGEN